MSELRQRSDGANRQNTHITPETGHYGITAETGHYGIEGQHAALVVRGPTRDEIRASGQGWEAAADIRDGVIEMASASGSKSEGEDLTLQTVEILVSRLNADGGTWATPERLGPNDGDDCEALDTRGHQRWRYRPLQVQVVRPRMPEHFWEGITGGSRMPSGSVQEAAEALWDAICKKKPARPGDGVLAINAIRTPWFSLSSIVDAFRQQYGEKVRTIGFREVWVVAWSKTLAKRLHP